MPTPSFRVTDELYDRIIEAAQGKEMPVSAFIRSAVEHVLDNPDTMLDIQNSQIYKDLQTQLSQKDAQIDQLHQIVAMAQSNQADTLKQLEASKVQRRWWFWRAERVKP